MRETALAATNRNAASRRRTSESQGQTEQTTIAVEARELSTLELKPQSSAMQEERRGQQSGVGES